ncbi:MAG: hypothetical protein MPW15_00700 [Candidatus Manganitrophus sp.]|nr:hypothetical protein [Candidatus Manganitrophus sp.]
MPKPPPMSGEITRILSSERPTWPATSARTVRMTWGACVVMISFNFPVTFSKWATQPQVSIEET